MANTTRVEERNTEPTHPKNHNDITATRSSCRMGLSKSIARADRGRARPRSGRIPPRRRRWIRSRSPTEGLGEEQEQDGGGRRGEQERPGHRVDVLAEVGGAADLAVEGGAPVRVKVEKCEEWDQEQRRIDGRAGLDAAGLLTGLDGLLVGVAAGAEELLGLAVKGRYEVLPELTIRTRIMAARPTSPP